MASIRPSQSTVELAALVLEELVVYEVVDVVLDTVAIMLPR
ncbi:hypothetical protein [Pseudolabrys sp. FHR47]|nr:hypothetical protein [Pseudolabrys sp. FHR47]